MYASAHLFCFLNDATYYRYKPLAERPDLLRAISNYPPEFLLRSTVRTEFPEGKPLPISDSDIRTLRVKTALHSVLPAFVTGILIEDSENVKVKIRLLPLMVTRIYSFAYVTDNNRSYWEINSVIKPVGDWL